MIFFWILDKEKVANQNSKEKITFEKWKKMKFPGLWTPDPASTARGLAVSNK
jgi:hypothetical protein